MNRDQRADPNCPTCHGSGLMELNTPFLDRVDEATVTCRCVTEAPAESETPSPDGSPTR